MAADETFDAQSATGWGSEGAHEYLTDDEDVGPPLDVDDEQ